MRKLSTVAFLALLLTPGVSFARATAASVQNFIPAIDDSRYLSVYSSQTLQQWQFRTGVYFNYARNPLEIGVTQRRAGLVEHLLMADIFGSVGLTDWFQLGLDAPVAIWGRATNFLTGEQQAFTRMGDLRFEPKLRILDIDRWSVGLALLPFLIIPTGDGDVLDVNPATSTIGRVGVGNNSFSGGAKLIVDVDILRRAQIAVNLGYIPRDNVVIFNTRQDDFFTYGLGINLALVSWLHFMGEAYGQTVVGEFFERQNELPFEIMGGFRILPPQVEGLQVTIGGGAGLTFGYGAPDFRTILGVSYMKPRRVKLPPPPPLPEEEAIARIEKARIVITKKVHFAFDKAVIRPISFHILDAVVEILKSNPEIRKVRVEGHTDFMGTDAYNMRLSQRRAEAVRRYLIAHGIQTSRLVAAGFGEGRPVATNETIVGRARNRRVEFIILEQEGFGPE